MPGVLVGNHLAGRLKELGIRTVFGVPGDYGLALIETLEREGLTWVGAPNELVAAYAADGYARIKGAAALFTTFGPGELSALAGIGGSFCEDVPIVHIVGHPALRIQKNDHGVVMHHTLADLRYDHYVKMFAEISVATTVLHDGEKAAAEIDRVLNAMVYHSKPVYIGIPEDLVHHEIQGAPTAEINLNLTADPETVQTTVTCIMEMLGSSKAPVLIVDGGGARHTWKAHVNPLIDALKIPFFVTSYGKGLATEESPHYSGPYAGPVSHANVIKALDKSDIILWLGCAQTDINT
jgi:pyruvate decarboxylase